MVAIKSYATSPGGTFIQSGTLAARPAAGVADRYYWATDIVTLFRDTGAAWEVVGAQYYVREILCHGSLATTSADTVGNQVYYSPVQVKRTLTADGVIVYHAGVAAGSLWTALYDHTGYLPVNQLAISVLTAANGINRAQFVPFTAPVQITPNVYFCAFHANASGDTYLNAVDHNSPVNPSDVGHGLKWFQEALALATPPPAVATPAYTTDRYNTRLMSLRVVVPLP